MSNLLPSIELNSITPSKFSIELLKQVVVTHFRETGENPLEMLVKAEALVQLLEGIRAELKEDVISHLDLHPQGKAIVLDAEIARIESGVMYIYDQDYTWSKMNEEIKSLKFALKEREKMLRTLPTAMVDPESGEMVHPAPRISTTTFKISLNK